MNITKQSETFVFADSTEAFEMRGCVTSKTNETLNLHLNVTRVGGDRMGDCSYSKYCESDSVNFNVICSEENCDELTTYANTVISTVLEYLKSSN